MYCQLFTQASWLIGPMQSRGVINFVAVNRFLQKVPACTHQSSEIMHVVNTESLNTFS